MADATEDIKKKCASTGTTLKRAKRYFREGHYFLNKNAYKTWAEKRQAEKAEKNAEKAKADEAAKATAVESKST